MLLLYYPEDEAQSNLHKCKKNIEYDFISIKGVERRNSINALFFSTFICKQCLCAGRK